MIKIPGGATSRVQSLDTVINKLFKNYVQQFFEKHVDENLEVNAEGTLFVTLSEVDTDYSNDFTESDFELESD